MASTEQKLSFWAMVAFVVGSMVGAGVFSLPATFGRSTGVAGALIAWTIAGSGMLMLAFVFQTLAARKPDLDAGVFIYAQEGFGNYMGFISGFGFWAGSCVGNVSYFVLIKSTLGAFFPIFGDGNTITAVLFASVLLWGYHFLILRGVKGAAAINTIVTVAKVVPLVVFIGVVIWAFNSDTFSMNMFSYNIVDNLKADLAGLEKYGFVGHAEMLIETVPAESLFTQVRNTMLVTVFVFLGIEGASVYSRLAKRREDVGSATVLGFLGVMALFVMVTLLSYGVMSRQELAALRQPSVAGVMEHLLGRPGAIFISVGLIVSVMGAYLSWALLAAEVLFSVAKSGSVPAAFSKENSEGVPANAMWLTSILIQVFLVVTLFTEYAFMLALELTSALSLIPYFFVGAYGYKLALSRETYDINPGARNKDLAIAALGTLYSLLMLYAGGLKYILLSALIYAPGSYLFIMARREQGVNVFTGSERTVFLGVVAAAAVAAYCLATGIITI